MTLEPVDAKQLFGEILCSGLRSDILLLAPMLVKGTVYKEVVVSVEKALVESALRHTKGNIFDASGFLGISKSSFYKKMKKYSLTYVKTIKQEEKESKENGSKCKSFEVSDGSGECDSENCILD